MKQTILLLATVTLMISCGDKKKTTTGDTASKETSNPVIEDNNDGKTSSFTVDGTSFTGKISTQHFGGESGNFSVLCQQDEPFALLQAVYANEKEATANTIYKPAGTAYNTPAGEVNIALSGTAIGAKEFTTKSESTGTITVDGKKLILKDLKLYDQDKNEKTVSGTIEW